MEVHPDQRMCPIEEHAAKPRRGRGSPHAPPIHDQLGELRTELVGTNESNQALDGQAASRNGQSNPRVFSPAPHSMRERVVEQVNGIRSPDDEPRPNRPLAPVFPRCDDQLIGGVEGLQERRRQH